MIANAVTLLRTLLTAPLFLLLAYSEGGYGWWPLVLFLGCGVLDIVDGQLARRLGQSSAFGAMLDLLGDRLLTLAAVTGLLVGGGLSGWAAAAGVALVVRDLIVASLNEALPGRLTTRGSLFEFVKVGLAFVGLSLLIAPAFLPQQTLWGSLALGLAAAASVLTTAAYWRQGLSAFRQR